MKTVYNLYLVEDPFGRGYIGCTYHAPEERWRLMAVTGLSLDELAPDAALPANDTASQSEAA